MLAIPWSSRYSLCCPITTKIEHYLCLYKKAVTLEQIALAMMMTKMIRLSCHATYTHLWRWGTSKTPVSHWSLSLSGIISPKTGVSVIPLYWYWRCETSDGMRKRATSVSHSNWCLRLHPLFGIYDDVKSIQFATEVCTNVEFARRVRSNSHTATNSGFTMDSVNSSGQLIC